MQDKESIAKVSIFYRNHKFELFGNSEFLNLYQNVPTCTILYQLLNFPRRLNLFYFGNSSTCRNYRQVADFSSATVKKSLQVAFCIRLYLFVSKNHLLHFPRRFNSLDYVEIKVGKAHKLRLSDCTAAGGGFPCRYAGKACRLFFLK